MSEKVFLPYGKPSITPEEVEAVSRVFQSDWLTRGPHVEAFESAVADYCKVSYAVAFSSGSAALAAACYAAELGPHDRVITTPNSFVATTGTAMTRGSKPVFLDIDLTTGNLDLEQIDLKINRPASRGREVIIPVHFAGIPVDMQVLQKKIKRPDTIVIEDAAHAIGSRYVDGMPVGSCAHSHMTMFSFHPVKNITTGEGGMVTTNDEELCRRLRLFRNNGIERDPLFLQGEAAPWYYEVQELTGNYNFTEIQAALGIGQLRRLDSMVAKRRELVRVYRKKLQGKSYIRLFTDRYDSHTAFHLFVVQVDFSALKINRTELMERLKRQGVGSQLHYIPIYKHPFFTRQYGDISAEFPQMEKYYQEALSLPLFYDMSEEDVWRVVDVLETSFHRKQE